MATNRDQLQAGIVALESQRTLLGDAVTDAALALLRARFSAPSITLPEAPAQALKQVTILFLDVVGSTSFSEQLDPEDIHEVMDGALESCSAIVASFCGKVLQYAGDSLLAVFGADVVREDDPERAVRAGLALLEEGRRQADLIERRHGRKGFDFRVGLHTGSVLLGGGVDAEGSIRGIAVSIAARMEQSTAAGTLRISRDTHRHVRGLFDVEAQPALSVKGLDEPVATYLVVGARPRSFRIGARGVEGVRTQMVGRDAELELLREAFRALHRNGRLTAVAVVGEAGVGKSRLLLEFQDWAETQPERITVFQGRAMPQTLGQPYGLLRDIVAARVGIGDDDSLAAARDKIEAGLTPLFRVEADENLAQAHAHLLGQLIGVDFSESRHIAGIRGDGKQIRDRGFHAAAQMFRRVAMQASTPIVLMIENLHWADDDSLAFLAHLARVDPDVPMLILGLTRPTLFERPGHWPVVADAQRIELGALDESASALLASELLKKLAEIPDDLRALLTRGAEGNPFYMEELVNVLVDRGAIEAGPDRWILHIDKLLATQVPQTLTAVLQARLDGLMPAEKLALQQASAIGFVFWDQTLAAIDVRAPDALPHMTRRAMIVSHQIPGFEGVREFAFSHQVLHRVTYDTVLKRLRRDYHGKAAAWLAGLTGVRANDFLGLAAEHFESAGDAANACEYFARAAAHGAGLYAHDAVIGYAGRALALVGADASTEAMHMRWRLLALRERSLDLQGRRAEQRADIDALQALADALDDDTRCAEVAWLRSDIALRTADFPAMEEAARQGMALALRAGAVELGLRAQQRLAVARSMLGDSAEGRALAQANLAAARALGLRRAEGLALSAVAAIANEQEDWIGTLEALQQKVLVERELGNRRSTCTTLINLGSAWAELGERTQSRLHLEEGLRLARDVGDRATECYPLLRLAVISLHEGDAAASLAHAQSALDIAVAMRDALLEANALCRVGDAELAFGRQDAAGTAFERAHAMATALKHVRQHDAAAGMARVALARGVPLQSLAPVQRLIDHVLSGGTLQGTDSRVIRLTCHLALARDGDQRAAEVLAEAHAELQARAASLADADLRHGFLAHIPEHRDIVSAWNALAPRPS